MPLQATSGAASYDAFGGGVPVAVNYIEEVFSTYLYPSVTGDNQIINNIDLSTKSGLVWIKSRDTANAHFLIDTVRGSSVGNTNAIKSNTTGAQTSGPFLDFLQFNNNGFTAKAVTGGGELGTNTYYGKMVSWTFRKQPKFFDVVTYTGDGVSARQIPHSLGSVPGCVIVKPISTTGDWGVWHRGDGTTDRTAFSLNSTSRSFNTGYISAFTSTHFRPVRVEDASSIDGNLSGVEYVAYLFAHDAGGFGLTGTDNVISCGSFDATSAGSVTLGYEPQWVLIKASNDVGSWHLHDNMRGYTTSGNNPTLDPDRSVAEFTGGYTNPTATGFTHGSLGSSFIYIAIRRGPMKVPTVGTSVFSPIAITPSSGTISTTNFPVDAMITTERTTGGTSRIVHDKLRGVGTVGAGNARIIVTNDVNAESAGSSITYNWWNTGFTWGSGFAGEAMVAWNFRRAPSFFDEVCYTGTGTAGQTYTHNLNAVPELMIVKSRSNTSNWFAYSSATGNTQYLLLNATVGVQTATSVWNNTTPTASVFTLGSSGAVNGSGSTYVAYLFATCAGVSKVGSYTGNGSTQTIDCGFTGGARFVMVKATSTTGNWIVADSARGIVAGNDPALYLNSTAAEVTGLDWIDADNSGFVVNETATIAANTNGVSYIFLAVA
jgi:hypothetical protein